MNHLALFILLALAMIFLVLNIVKGFPLWPTVLILLLFLVLSLTGCAIDSDGNPTVQTPKVSIPVGKNGASVFGYAVLGFHTDKTTQLIQQMGLSKDL